MSSKSSSQLSTGAVASPSSSSSASAGAAASRKRSRNSSTPSRNPRKVLRPKSRSPFADFGSYMVEKNRKLRAQFQADASIWKLGTGSSLAAVANSDEDKGIFYGVSIFVDGFTIPSSQELRGCMLKHGGRFENYFSRHTVTHIICSNLPDSKMRNLQAFSHGLPVVRPEWVLDCLAANRLLSCAPYQLGELPHGTCKQQKLSSYFYRQGTSSCRDAKSTINHDVKIDVGPKHSVLPVEGQTSRCSGQVSEDLACLKNEEQSGDTSENPEPTNLEDGFNVLDTSGSVHTHLSMVNSNFPENEKLKESLALSCIGTSNQGHSTLTDPNFVEHYFKSSRLHFIGTWRNRYRKRFSKLLTGAKSRNEKVNSHSTGQKTAIIHIDMDCFFVSVIIRNCPNLLDKPVAVSHSNNPNGTAEISSANYVARDYGVRAGMFVRNAKARCPHLVILPYDFEAYEEVAEQFYSILHKHCGKVQALSCDEAFLDVTGCGNDPEELASMIRKEIAETTHCTASAGIAENLLLARLATRSAKPNGQLFIQSEKVEDYLNDLPIMTLPGIGHATYEKLKSRQIQTCGQMRMISKEALQKDFGIKIGNMLWNYCRGIDDRTVEVVQETKSVGAEVNWGIRFNGITDCHYFLMNLCKEVSLRLRGCGLQGRTITLKVKKRKKGAAEPIKFMGCGDCENMSRSITVPIATDNAVVLQRIAKQIFSNFDIDVKEVRGIGLQITRLESMDISRKGHEDNTLESWINSSLDETRKNFKQITWSDKQCNSGADASFSCPLPYALYNSFYIATDLPNGGAQSKCTDNSKQQDQGEPRPCCISITGYNCPSDKDASCASSYEMRSSTLPPLCDLDIDVVKNLPTEIIVEMDDLYKGELSDFIKKSEKAGCINACLSSVSLPSENINDAGACITGGHIDSTELVLGSTNKGKLPICEPLNPEIVGLCRSNSSNEKEQVQCTVPENEKTCLKVQSTYNACSRLHDLYMTSTMGSKLLELMPASLSQADASVLEQLPEDLKVDLFGILPVHRVLKSCRDAPTGVAFPSGVQIWSHYSKTNLWSGSPPCWVEKFKKSNNGFLNAIAMLCANSGKDILLSSILQSVVPFLSSVSQSSNKAYDEAFSSFHELLVQYIDLKIASDIEELYNCFCFLKRFSSLSKLLLQVYDSALPLFQASLSDNYGGELRLSVIHEQSTED